MHLKYKRKLFSKLQPLLTASCLISLQRAKCKKSYSIGEELIKRSLTAACNEGLG
jgi:hypothetical protein